MDLLNLIKQLEQSILTRNTITIRDGADTISYEHNERFNTIINDTLYSNCYRLFLKPDTLHIMNDTEKTINIQDINTVVIE